MRVHTPFSKGYILFLTTRPITVLDKPKGCSIIDSNVDTNSLFATRKRKGCKRFSSCDNNIQYYHYLFLLTSINQAGEPDGVCRLLLDKFCSNGQQGVCVIFFHMNPNDWTDLVLKMFVFNQALLWLFCQKILIHSDLITLKEINSPGFQTVSITYKYFQYSKYVTL